MKALTAGSVHETSITNLSPVKKVVNGVFEQLQNNYQFDNDLKVGQFVIIIIQIMRGNFNESDLVQVTKIRLQLFLLVAKGINSSFLCMYGFSQSWNYEMQVCGIEIFHTMFAINKLIKLAWVFY